MNFGGRSRGRESTSVASSAFTGAAAASQSKLPRLKAWLHEAMPQVARRAVGCRTIGLLYWIIFCD